MRIRPFPPLSSLGWPAWLGTLAGVAALCAIAAWWMLQVLAPAAPIAPASSAGSTQALPELRLAAHLFGTAAGPQGAVAAAPSNISVLGVLSAESRGSAILSVDGQPPKAYAVGEAVTPSQTLLAVNGDTVLIGENGRQVELAAPERASLSLLSNGPERPEGLHPGFTPPPGSAPRIARPLGASGGGPAPVLAAPRPGFAPPPRPGPIPGIVPVIPPAPAVDTPASAVPEAAGSLPTAPQGIAMPGTPGAGGADR
jgi:general secretion pathway protein C